ncbi:hypothetical protein C9I57_30340 [Trinickia symbiotica]|uniref:Uncharacterized protein n=1 Tax=Trinickia symbiotica TaxID=863227 RepID=A0A2T3XKE9_9BURK|nr:hypothetical protein C9I57_30340 [Trinickia symbiotica]
MLDLAREAGMAVMLDACIGRERYHSVTGSCSALERFAQACQRAACTTTDEARDRTTLEQWVSACEQGRSREVGRAIRAWLDESYAMGQTGDRHEAEMNETPLGIGWGKGSH